MRERKDSCRVNGQKDQQGRAGRVAPLPDRSELAHAEPGTR